MLGSHLIFPAKFVLIRYKKSFPIYSLTTQVPEVVEVSNPYSFTAPGKFLGLMGRVAFQLFTLPEVAASRALVTSSEVAKR